MLGQGNRTALPICGYFLASVLSDPAFKKYRAKCPTPADLNLDASQFNCGGYYNVEPDSDAISGDSIDAENIEQDVEIDGEGNIVNKSQEPATTKPATSSTVNGEATDPKKKAQPQYEDVHF